ncbi:MAG: PLxRFG domain-containing protein, partial [Comamonadaceae bacterium]
PAPAPDPISVEMAAYAKRMADRPALEDSDILNAMGRPFTNLRAASKAAQAAGSDYAPFKLDDQAFVVRKQQVPSQSPSQPPSQNPSEGAAPIPATNPGDANGNQTQTPSQAAQEVLTPASGTPQVLPAEPDNIPGDAHAQTAQAVQTETPPATQAAALMPAPDPVLSRAKPIDSGPAVVLQNRDRSSAASIAQMHEIAAKPDYLRAGQSSVMDSGAPVVFGDLPPSAVRGKAQEIADGKGQRTPIQYAVVDAPDLIASHLADGTSVQAYAQGSPGKLRAVAGNGRAAGIIEGYARGTAQQYRDDLAKDAQALGLDPGALAALHAPVLVRVMDSKDVTPDMGDRSNITGTARLSSVEQASTDARRLNLQSLEFHEDGNPTQAAVTEFVRAMPTSEQAELMAPDGTPTKQAVDRLMAATFKQAYGSDALVGLYAQAQDPQARTILSGLADAAAGMASLKDSGEFDIRAAVTEAAGYAVNARRLGQRLSDMLKTADMMMSDEALVVAQFMAENVRSAKKISQGLRNVAQYAAQQAHIEHDNTTQEGMFGATPTASRSDILRKLHANQPLVAATATPSSVTPSTAPQDHLQRPPGTPEAQGVAQPTQAARPEAEPVAASEPVEPAPAVARAEPEVEPLTLASYTNADALQRERHLADTARLDQREQIQREASDQTLTSETPVDARQDSTGEMFARERTQAQAQAAREELNTRNAGKPTAVDPNQGSMFDAPAVPAHENTLNPHETDTGVAMFSQGEVSHPSTVPAVESAIHELTGTFLGSQLGRIVATTASDIKSTWEPLIGKDLHLEFDRGAGHAQGFFDPTSKTIFLIADQIEAGTEQAVLAHELMHKHGQAVLGERGWNHLHSVIDGWKGAPEGSSERAVYDYASARVNAAGVDLSSQELFPYAVEAALKLGIKPNAFAKQGTAAKWLAQVKLALKTVWDKLTGKPDKFKAQDLVNLAFGIAQKENHAVETFNDGKSRVRSSTGKFRGWPKYNSWTRAEYQDVVSLLPEVYRSDPHRREPFSTRDWDLLADSALPEIKDLNDRVGPGTFGLDGLGNIVADARNNDASIFADEAIAIADKHDLGIYLTGVHPRSFVRLRDAGFVPELGLSLILLRESGSNQMPFAQADNVYANPAYGIVMSRKPRGFAAPMFSRAAGKALIERATDNLGQTFSHPGKLSWWDKTVGSPYHLAQRYPAFKPVFTSAQNFINDVSFYATEAADMAAKMLPKLENWSDLLKTPISAADNKAISVPILEGTLNWSRDDAGKPLRIAQDDEETTPGIVWSDAELHSLFHLTPPRIALYREFRSSVDKSLDNLGKADLLRIGGKDTAELKDAVMAAKDVIQAAILLHRHLHAQQYLMPERTEVLIDAARGMVARANKIERLKQLGYAPLSRFGRYWVDVVVDGRRQYFGLFETGRAANQMAKRLKAEFGPQNVAQGTLSEREFEMFQGITPESLELFGNMLGLDSVGDQAQDKVFQTYLKRTKSNRSAMKRLIHRKGTAGYSDDMGRVLAAFVYSNARQTSAALHMG